MNELTGFDEKQIAYAAQWWGGTLIGVDIQNDRRSLPEIVTRQSGEDQGLTLGLFSFAFNQTDRGFTVEQVQAFKDALEKNITLAIQGRFRETCHYKMNQFQEASCSPQVKNSCNFYLGLGESDWNTSPVLIKSCDDAGIDSSALCTYGHNKTLYLHKDGQIYVADGSSYHHLSYEGCPAPAYEVHYADDIRFDSSMYQIDYGLVRVATLPKGAPVPQGWQAPGPVKTQDGVFQQNIYACVMQSEVENFDELSVADLTDPTRVPPDKIYMKNLESGDGLDYLKEGLTPYGMRGDTLVAIKPEEGLFRCVSAVFNKTEITSKIQIGCGPENVQLNSGDILLKGKMDRHFDCEGKPVDFVSMPGKNIKKQINPDLVITPVP